MSESSDLPFTIFDVTAWTRIGHEQMGTKRKFWCRRPDDERLWLFKVGRSHAGEHWAEKVVCEIALILGIPCAKVELATCLLDSANQTGTISLDFTDEKQYGSLVHGNELLQERDPKYPAFGPNFRVAQHSLGKILSVLDQDFITIPAGLNLPAQVQSASDLFVGYLMLDSLVVNTDRHHENWGVILRAKVDGKRRAELAPTFDHASSLGRELSDPRRIQKLAADQQLASGNAGIARTQTVSGYLEKDEGRCRIFGLESDAKPMHVLEVFRAVYELKRHTSEAWLDRLEATPQNAMVEVVDRIPGNLMSEPAKQFAKRLIELNRNALISRKFHHG